MWTRVEAAEREREREREEGRGHALKPPSGEVAKNMQQFN
jgi:hypothetical protein